MDLAAQYLETSIKTFKSQKRMAETAMQQLEPVAFHVLLDEDSTSIAMIVKHLSGNMRSRWQDFLSSDGEKPDRDRDDEFVDDFESHESIWQTWSEGWTVLLDTLESLSSEDIYGTVTIRGEPHKVIEAIERQLSHYAYHVGQIVFLARHLCEGEWQTLSIPKGGSKAFNKKMSQAATVKGISS